MAADISPLAQHFEDDLGAERKTAEQNQGSAQMFINEGDDLCGIFFNRGEWAIAPRVAVQDREDHAVFQTEDLRGFAVIPPGESASVEQNDRFPVFGAEFLIMHRCTLSLSRIKNFFPWNWI